MPGSRGNLLFLPAVGNQQTSIVLGDNIHQVSDMSVSSQYHGSNDLNPSHSWALTGQQLSAGADYL